MSTCRTCEASYPDAGDGWDGECPDCADKTEECLDIVVRARELFAQDDIQIDDDPALSHGEDGTWVQAWVLVPNQEG